MHPSTNTEQINYTTYSAGSLKYNALSGRTMHIISSMKR